MDWIMTNWEEIIQIYISWENKLIFALEINIKN